MEGSANIITLAQSSDSFPRELAGLFWLARALTGSDEAAVACLLKAIDGGALTRMAVIEAACECLLSSQFKSAGLKLSNGEIPIVNKGMTLNSENILEVFHKMEALLRYVWILGYAEGYSTTEIARLLDVPPGVVTNALSKAAVGLASIL